MKPHYLASLALLASMALGCRTTQNASKTKDIDWADTTGIPALKCEAGDPVSFALKPVFKPKEKKEDPDVPAYTPADFPVLKGAPEDFEAWRSETLIRLDGCNVGDDVDVVRILIGDDQVMKVHTPAAVPKDKDGSEIEKSPTANGEIRNTGLKEAFEEDFSKLAARIPVEAIIEKVADEKDPKKTKDVVVGYEVVYLQGSKDGSAVALTIATERDGKTFFSDRFLNAYYFGVLKYEDQGVGKKCEEIATIKGDFTIATATFTWMGIEGMGTSGGVAPKLCEFTVVDTAKELGSKAGQVTKFNLPLGQETDDFKFEGNHHSVCDSFFIKTAGATYGLTASSLGFGGGTCDSIEAGAPKATDGGTNYIFTYGTKKVEDTAKDCKHPTRQCGSIKRLDSKTGEWKE